MWSHSPAANQLPRCCAPRLAQRGVTLSPGSLMTVGEMINVVKTSSSCAARPRTLTRRVFINPPVVVGKNGKTAWHPNPNPPRSHVCSALGGWPSWRWWWSRRRWNTTPDYYWSRFHSRLLLQTGSSLPTYNTSSNCYTFPPSNSGFSGEKMRF